MEKAAYDMGVTEREFHILSDLYNYRALTTDQIRRKYFSDSKYAVDYVLKKLRQRKMIRSNTLRGSRDKRKGYSYHRITEQGMECLARRGMMINDHAGNLYVKPNYLPYVLLANDVMVDLTKAGWEVWDSRKVKREYNLDKGKQIHGLLIAPNGKKYGYYTMAKGIMINNLAKIITEIRDTHEYIGNFIVFSKGKGSHDQFIKYATDPPAKREGGKMIAQKPLYIGYDLKVLPMKLGIGILSKYPTREKWIRALARHIGFEVISDISESADNGIEGTGRNGTVRQHSRQSFPTIIRHKGEEKYFVDLTDTNLTLVSKINSYNQHDYILENKRKVIVTIFDEQQKEILNLDNPNIELLLLNANDYNKLMS
jgi:Replication-relaxation